MRRNVNKTRTSVFVYVGQPETVRPGQVYRYQGKPYPWDCATMPRPSRSALEETPGDVSRLHDIRRTIYSTPPSVNSAPTRRYARSRCLKNEPPERKQTMKTNRKPTENRRPPPPRNAPSFAGERPPSRASSK
jgi:hypothetical protein